MKKYYTLLTAFLFIYQFAFSQTAPIVAAQKSFGGSRYDQAKVIRKTPDKGFIVAANTASPTTPGYHGLYDLWIQKFNKKGKVEWSKCYGGSLDDYVIAIETTNDNGYIISGTTTSNDGDVTGHHGVGYDVWVVKIDSVGNIQWSRCYGGTDYDDEAHIIPTDDGGYLFAATSGSADGDATGITGKGGYDVWVVKTSATGTIEWQKKYGGFDGDFAGSIKKVTGGGYIIGGGTYSNLPGKHGDMQDCYVLRIDNAGTLLWQKCYGGTSEEGYANIKNTPDGGFIFVSTASSGDGDVTGVHSPYEDEFYVYDIWLVKLSAAGAIEWQKVFGGYANDYGEDVQKTSDGGYIVCGLAASADGDVVGNHGDGDAWIIKTTSNGTMEWQLCAGGSLNDGAASITSDFGNGNYIFTGFNMSSDGDCTSNKGGGDVWVVQLAPPATASLATSGKADAITTLINKMYVYPNPVKNTAIVNFVAAKESSYTIAINDINGREVYRAAYKATPGINKVPVNIANITKGIYFIKLQQGSAVVQTAKLVKD